MSNEQTTPDEYFGALAKEKRKVLQKIRGLIKSIIPDVEERLSSGAPFFWYAGKRAVGLGATKKHLSFFIMHGKVLKRYQKELTAYNTSSTVIRFTADKPIPVQLISKLIKARMKEIDEAQQ